MRDIACVASVPDPVQAKCCVSRAREDSGLAKIGNIRSRATQHFARTGTLATQVRPERDAARR